MSALIWLTRAPDEVFVGHLLHRRLVCFSGSSGILRQHENPFIIKARQSAAQSTAFSHCRGQSLKSSSSKKDVLPGRTHKHSHNPDSRAISCQWCREALVDRGVFGLPGRTSRAHELWICIFGRSLDFCQGVENLRFHVLCQQVCILILRRFLESSELLRASVMWSLICPQRCSPHPHLQKSAQPWPLRSCLSFRCT